MKFGLDGRSRLNISTLNKEIIIASNGPPMSQLNELIYKAKEIWLSKHRSPIICDTKYNTSSVIDRHNKLRSTFLWH